MSALVARRRRLWAAGGLAATALAALPMSVVAHPSDVAPPALGLGVAASSWGLEPLALIGLAAAATLYGVGVRRVDRAHPTTPVPRRRLVAWFGGLAIIAVALFSFLDVYATTLFSVHMVQHLLLAMVGAPLLLLGAPITLLLRAATPEVRRRRILPVLQSRPVRVISHPAVGWLALAIVVWASHFSLLFEAALDDPVTHAVEHALYLGAGLLFWWPVIGVDPHPVRLSHGLRIGYVLAAMPLNSFLGFVLFAAPTVLYAHYATVQRVWGPTPLEDQQLAGGIMWAAGDLLFLVPVLYLTVLWFRSEEEKGRLHDEQLDRERARREREGAPIA
ncbi:MAG TPA: cytochrome c oxidase assembly protein [Candidatus Limnocylindrales bacterium]|jgi:putative copper resistance protein D